MSESDVWRRSPQELVRLWDVKTGINIPEFRRLSVGCNEGERTYVLDGLLHGFSPRNQSCRPFSTTETLGRIQSVPGGARANYRILAVRTRARAHLRPVLGAARRVLGRFGGVPDVRSSTLGRPLSDDQ